MKDFPNVTVLHEISFFTRIAKSVNARVNLIPFEGGLDFLGVPSLLDINGRDI